MRVLVVEDDLDAREGLKNLLEMWGHAVDVAGNGKDGIEQAILHRPRVALIDIGLPELDGYQVASRIREALGSTDIFLVAITGYADARERAHALENGFDAHVAKPIDFSKLSSILEAKKVESAQVRVKG
ncbi:MAG: response regulator [Acidobacteriota bacterium]